MVPVVIFCGGKGTRLRDLNVNTPKSLTEVGGKPIINHIIDHYVQFGNTSFILATGYRDKAFRDFFTNNPPIGIDVVFDYAGEDAGTAKRLLSVIENYPNESFYVSYGDTLCDVDVQQLYCHHIERNSLLTVTAVRPRLPFGVFSFEESTIRFKEKPVADIWVNSGFMVINRNIKRYLENVEMLERGAFDNLFSTGKASLYYHNGNWECMDTYKDFLTLSERWGQTQSLFEKK